MTPIGSWDYLVLTASNDLQARAYEGQLRARRDLGLLADVRETLVIPDLEGKRIGSGGSTLYCLIEILRRECARRGVVATPDGIRDALRGLRILIVHAGGDSRRLPAYGPCGKIFVPLPGNSDSPLPPALFDRLVPAFLALPTGPPGSGQVVVTSGDALIRFDARGVTLSHPGLIALGAYATPEEASRHGVFCAGPDGVVTRYLQKPSIETQRRAGAIDAQGRTALDIGVMHMDGETSAALLAAFGAEAAGDSALDFNSPARARVLDWGVDLYREICCALGSEATLESYIEGARASGSTWPPDLLATVFPALRQIPLHVELFPECRFLHFGSTRQLMESGLALVEEDEGRPSSTVLQVNTLVEGAGHIAGTDSWVEGCRIAAPLTLEGRNVAVGVDVRTELTLPAGACLEVLRGVNRRGGKIWFVRCYGVGDTFKDSLPKGASFCGKPLLHWLAAAGIDPSEVWPDVEDPALRSLWNACVFPAVDDPTDYREWLWMYAPEAAGEEALRGFIMADRYSSEEIAVLTDQAAFHERRLEIWRNSKEN